LHIFFAGQTFSQIAADDLRFREPPPTEVKIQSNYVLINTKKQQPVTTAPGVRDNDLKVKVEDGMKAKDDLDIMENMKKMATDKSVTTTKSPKKSSITTYKNTQKYWTKSATSKTQKPFVTKTTFKIDDMKSKSTTTSTITTTTSTTITTTTSTTIITTTEPVRKEVEDNENRVEAASNLAEDIGEAEANDEEVYCDATPDYNLFRNGLGTTGI
jgi:hypothetical protein